MKRSIVGRFMLALLTSGVLAGARAGMQEQGLRPLGRGIIGIRAGEYVALDIYGYREDTPEFGILSGNGLRRLTADEIRLHWTDVEHDVPAALRYDARRVYALWREFPDMKVY